MTTARRQIVDVNITRYYHCISRCVRRAKLCGKGFEHRKQFIEDRLQLLAENFAISVAGFAVMDNHWHVLLRLDPEVAQEWSAEEVIRRWIAVHRPLYLDFDDEKLVDSWVAHQAKNARYVETIRQRLCCLGWFHKAIKEPLARMANKEDGCRGAFWEGRFKSIAVLDAEALLATNLYIDLNPYAAGLSDLPEASLHTSIRQRVAHVRKQGKLDRLDAARMGSVEGSKAAGNLEQGHWLIPIEDRRPLGESDSQIGMLESFSLGSYLLLLDHTCRMFRNGKARLNAGVTEILERLGTKEKRWWSRLKRMLNGDTLHGHYFAGNRTLLRQLADKCGKHHLANLSARSLG